jgi:hypothetical protein
MILGRALALEGLRLRVSFDFFQLDLLSRKIGS